MVTIKLTWCKSRMIIEGELRVSVQTIGESTRRVDSKITERLENMLDKYWIEIDEVYNKETKLMDFFYLKRSR